jgi:XTP/dITP diphosphohydrolase
MKVVLATTNPGKLKELKALAANESWLELVLAPEGFNPEETGKTFIENAKIKARVAAQMSGAMSVADDSGLIVEALNGRPGIHSARYCEGTDEDRRNKLLAELDKTPDDRRQAAFMCAMAVADPDGSIAYTAIRFWEGMIVREAKGANGFGYDPIFRPNTKSITAAELEPEEKNRISHRGQAWNQVLSFLRQQHQQLTRTT